MEVSLKHDDVQIEALRFAAQHNQPLDAVINDAVKDYLAKAS